MSDRVDPRAFVERTTLAWQRSAVALALVGALGLRAAAHRHHAALGIVLIGGLLAGCAGILAAAERRYATRTTGGEGALLALTLVTVAAAAVGTVIALA